jgi:hypothetical protein
VNVDTHLDLKVRVPLFDDLQQEWKDDRDRIDLNLAQPIQELAQSSLEGLGPLLIP